MSRTQYHKAMIAAVRTIPLWKDADDAVIGAHVLAKLGAEAWTDVQDPEQALAYIQAYVTGGIPALAPLAETQDDAPLAEDDDYPWWYELPPPAKPDHTDWRVSVTPTARGEYETPTGVRFNMTFHDGATEKEAVELIGLMEATMRTLGRYGIKLAKRQQAQPAAPPGPFNPPPASRGRPADQPRQDAQSEPGQKVFGVEGDCYPGPEYILEAGRIVGDPTQNGDPRVQFVYTHSKYDNGVPAFPGKEGANFAHIYDVTGYNPEDFVKGATVEFDPPLRVVFRLGNPKPNGNGRYLEFVRIDAGDADEPF